MSTDSKIGILPEFNLIEIKCLSCFPLISGNDHLDRV